MCTHTFDRLSLQTNVQALLFDIQSGEMAGNSKHALFSSDYFLTNRHFSYDFPIFDLKVTKKEHLWFFLPFSTKQKWHVFQFWDVSQKWPPTGTLKKQSVYFWQKSIIFGPQNWLFSGFDDLFFCWEEGTDQITSSTAKIFFGFSIFCLFGVVHNICLHLVLKKEHMIIFSFCFGWWW